MDSIKLLALDMDGTSYYSLGNIIPSNIIPLKKAMKNGVEIVFSTGRAVHSRQNAIGENGFVGNDSIMIAYNGGCIYDLSHQKILKKSPIKSKMAKKIFDLCKMAEFKEAVIFGYVDDFKTVVSNVKNPSVKKNKIKKYQLEMDFFDGEYLEYSQVQNDFNFNFFKILIFNGNLNLFNLLKKMELTIAINFNIEAEINALDVDKGHALKWVAERRKLIPEQIMAIGDGANDISMLKYAHYAVSLENSIPQIKKIANIHIPLTNIEGGVGYAVEKYILKENKNES